MRHVLFEFITGGGLSGQVLPDSLVYEGNLMLKALVYDLVDANHRNIVLMRDSRLELLDKPIKQYVIDGDIKQTLTEIINPDDTVWLIAPETDNILASYVDFFFTYGCRLMCSTIEVIQLTSSKMNTFQQLKSTHIATIETRYLNQELPNSNNGWIVKSDDGAGAKDCYFFYDENRLNNFRYNVNEKHYIVQPFLKGKHMSMSLIVYQGRASVLACNQQYLQLEDDQLRLMAIGVNECLDYLEPLRIKAKKIAQVISGLAGYIGIDLVMVDNDFFIVDINPRFTTAYVGLSKSLNMNVADLVLKTFQSKQIPNIDIVSAKPIRVNL